MRSKRLVFLSTVLALGCARAERSSPAPLTPEPIASFAPAASASPVRPPAGRGKNALFGLVRPAADLSEETRVLSPDKSLAGFVKDKPLGVWISDADGTNARALFDVNSVRAENPPEGTSLRKTSGIFHLEFSPDGKRIYFQADGWGTSLALYSVEPSSQRVRFVHDANGYEVIRACSDPKQIGRLIIFEHRYFDPIPTSAVDWYFLIDDRAKRYGIVGPGEDNVDRFLANTCGVGKTFPAPEPDDIPRGLEKNVTCKNEILKRKNIAFLDGTSLDLFFLYDAGELAQNPKTLPMVLGPRDAKQWEEIQCEGRNR